MEIPLKPPKRDKCQPTSISIPCDIREKMRKYPWVNWSGVCLQAIQLAISQLEKGK